jgi:hypothetical protein
MCMYINLYVYINYLDINIKYIRIRNNHCIKEVSDLKADLCGKTQYFGDYWDAELGICYFKKCSEACIEGEYTFKFGPKTYTRTRYCCNDKNYCNSGFKLSNEIYFTVFMSMSIVTIIMSIL